MSLEIRRIERHRWEVWEINSDDLDYPGESWEALRAICGSKKTACQFVKENEKPKDSQP